MEASPQEKEEKFIIHEERVPFFSTKKLVRLFLAVFLAFFGAFGLLFFIDITIYPDLGMMELARKAQEKTDAWRTAKRTDLGHEAIAFENMLDAYALRGGDISHALDSLTSEFTAANWAELLEYDVDYFLKHEEVNDSTKSSGMLHVTKILYSSGHYDLFKQGYKILTERFASDPDFLTIYADLIALDADFDYDDEEERAELAILYELELRRHLKMTAAQIILATEAGNMEEAALQSFAANLKQKLESYDPLSDKGDKFLEQVENDLVIILTLIRDSGDVSENLELLRAGYDLASYLSDKGMVTASDLSPTYLTLIEKYSG